MKTRIFLVATFFVIFSYSQESNIKKEDWFVNSTIGFAQIEIENVGSYNGFVFANNISKEFLLKKNTSLLLGIELQNIFYNSNTDEADLYTKNTFLKIPLNYRYTSSKNSNTRVFIDFGLYGSLLIRNKVESVLEIESDNNSGTNFGLSLGFGMSQKVNNFINFNINLITQSDLIENYKGNNNEIKIKNLYGVNLGIGIQL